MRSSTSSIVNSRGYRKHFDAVLKRELGELYINTPGFYKAFFQGIEWLRPPGLYLKDVREGRIPFTATSLAGENGRVKEEDILS